MTAVRLDPDLLTRVKRHSGNLSQTIEQELGAWVEREEAQVAVLEQGDRETAPASPGPSASSEAEQ